MGAVQLWVMRRGMILTGAGLAIGLAASLAVTRAIATLLYGVGATDPLTFAAAACSLLAIALAASCLPAWRAAHVDPVETLRHG
jgi:ABC-type lipoprotein release transport system permease subunit